MPLKLDDVHEDDRGALSPCGIMCLGCDAHRGESLEAARKVVDIWEGFNLADVAMVMGLSGDEVAATLEGIKKVSACLGQKGACPGCFNRDLDTQMCAIFKCVKDKGYWTCAECDDYDPASPAPCSQMDPAPIPFASRGGMSELISKRYAGTTRDNLQRCREVGYGAFLEEIKRKVGEGYGTWQVISPEKVFSEAMPSKKSDDEQPG